MLPEDGNSADELVKATDDALYQAERQAKNRLVAVSFFDNAQEPSGLVP